MSRRALALLFCAAFAHLSLHAPAVVRALPNQEPLGGGGGDSAPSPPGPAAQLRDGADATSSTPPSTLGQAPVAVPAPAPVPVAAPVPAINGERQQFIKRVANDANKELIDYEDQTLDSLDFVQTLKQADGQARVSAMLARHHNQEELHEYLAEVARLYPEVARLYSIGKSVEGRELWALELTEQPGKHQLLKPEFRYVANMHGNEVVGRELLLHLARLLAENYRAAQEERPGDLDRPTGPKFVRKLLNSTRIHLLPTLNPDGYARSEIGCVYEQPSRKGRVNANNIDLNRNFPSKILGTKLDLSTQPETLAFIKWSRQEPFVLSANLHGGALVASIPWDGARDRTLERETRPTPDDDVFKRLATVYSTSHKTMSSGADCYDRCSDYHGEHKFPMGITNGAQWYSLHGSLQDWCYENTNELDITLELGCDQYPAESALPTYWEYNKRALLNYVREVHKGIKGQVLERRTGKPLANVTVRVSGRDHDTLTNANGEFYRLLLPGVYEISFERADLKPRRATINIAHGGMAQILHVNMTRKDDTASVGDENDDDDQGQLAAAGQLALGSDAATNKSDNGDHSIVVATLVMSVISVAMLIMMAGAYVIQKRRLVRSQSVSVEMQPRSAGTGVSLSAKTSSTSLGVPGGSGSSTNHPHL